MITIEPGPPRGVTAHASDEAALIFALRFAADRERPGGTAALYVNADDRAGYDERAAQYRSLADDLESEVLYLECH